MGAWTVHFISSSFALIFLVIFFFALGIPSRKSLIFFSVLIACPGGVLTVIIACNILHHWCWVCVEAVALFVVFLPCFVALFYLFLVGVGFV